MLGRILGVAALKDAAFAKCLGMFMAKDLGRNAPEQGRFRGPFGADMGKVNLALGGGQAAWARPIWRGRPQSVAAILLKG